MLMVTGAGVLQRVRDVENPSSPKYITVDRGGDDRGSVCYGVGVDDEREHHPVRRGTSGCESV